MNATSIKVKNLRDAAYAECKACGLIIEPGLYWGLSKRMNLHSYGCGDNKYQLWGVVGLGKDGED